MTQGIENMLNLPSMESLLEDVQKTEENFEAVSMTNVPEIASVASGEDHSDSMEKMYKETLQHAQDLMELGFNIDHARARGIFEIAANMFGRAIEAKNSKRDAQLKLMKLMLDQRKQELAEKKSGEGPATIEDESVIVSDRNSLLKMFRDAAIADSKNT